MTVRDRATEIAGLVRRLGSQRPEAVKAARTRLALIGARAVESLVEALEHDDNRIRGHAMQLLALIHDPRARGPLEAMLLDRDAKMREIAARCLGRFPNEDSVAALERFLEREKRPDGRAAAVHALLEQYAAGQEQAIRQPIALMSDTGEDPRVRIAAAGLLPMLRVAERRGILRRLKQDPSDEVSRKACELEALRDEEGPEGTARLKASLGALASRDPVVWNEAVHHLAAHGSTVVAPLVAEMQRRDHDPEFCARAGMVLKSLGPRRARSLADSLDRIEEPGPLQVLVEVVGALGEKPLIYRLKDLIERVSGLQNGAGEVNGFDPMHRVRAKAHLELARIGSRVAIQDLRDSLADPEQRVELEMIAALGMIGKRDEIVFLLRAYDREDRFIRERIAGVVRAIMKRERIRRADPIFQTLGRQERRSLDSILSATASTARRSGLPSRRASLTHSRAE